MAETRMLRALTGLCVVAFLAGCATSKPTAGTPSGRVSSTSPQPGATSSASPSSTSGTVSPQPVRIVGNVDTYLGTYRTGKLDGDRASGCIWLAAPRPPTFFAILIKPSGRLSVTWTPRLTILKNGVPFLSQGQTATLANLDNAAMETVPNECRVPRFGQVMAIIDETMIKRG